MSGHYAEDLIGRSFGNLVVIGRDKNSVLCMGGGKKSIHARWICECKCGTIKSIRGDHLRAGKIISCGCVGETNRQEALKKHMQSKTRLYVVYRNIISRCYNPNIRSYKNYGAQGVIMCDEWRNDFSAFSKWAYENGYDPDAKYGECTIDRINVYGNYEPDNCRWVTLYEQSQNKRKKVVWG